MQLLNSGRTDVGQKRDHNEDYILVDEALGLFLVCDGMGGHEGGEIASEMAADTVKSMLANEQATITDYDGSKSAREAVCDLLERAVNIASLKVYEAGTSGEKGKAGMGTTLTLMVRLTDQESACAHVGDSRLYLRRRGRVHQITDDHSYVSEMVRRGLLSLEQAKNSPYANVITRAVGIQNSVKADVKIFDTLKGDTYLICSDGLYRYFDENIDELGNILDNDALQTIPPQLIRLANERGGEDNISAIVLRCTSDGDEAHDTAFSTEVNLRHDVVRHVFLFKNLSYSERVSVMNALRLENCRSGEVVVKEGDKGESFFIVLEGTLEVSKAGSFLASLTGGTHFGEMSLLNDVPRTATVTATEESRLLIMHRESFDELTREDPALGLKLYRTFARVLSRRLGDALEAGGSSSPEVDTINMRIPVELFGDADG